MWCLSVSLLFYKSGPRRVFGEFRREISARTSRGGCHWLTDGSYRHGMAIITPGDYREEEERVQATVGKTITYRVEEGRGAVEKGEWTARPWELGGGRVEQLPASGSHT